MGASQSNSTRHLRRFCQASVKSAATRFAVQASLPGNPTSYCPMTHTRTALIHVVLACVASLPLWGQDRQSAEPVARVPFELHRNKILVPVTVGPSEPLTFILDTGSPVTVVTSHETAEGLGLELLGDVRARGAGTGAPPRSSIAAPTSVALDTIALDSARILVMEIETPLAAASGRRYRGILGRLLFERYVVRLDFRNRWLELYEPDGFTPPDGATVLPLRLEGGHPHVDTWAVLAQGDTVALDLVIDTGAKLSLALDLGPRVSLPDRTVEMIVGHGANGPVPGRVGRVPQLTLGDTAVFDVLAAFVDDELGVTPGADGNLGVGSLERFDVTFDYPHSRLVLEPTPRLGHPFGVDLSGITLAAEGEDFEDVVVGWVRPGSPADTAGVRAGDRIVTVDGRRSLTLEEIESRLERAGPVRLVLFQDGTEREAVLELHPVL